MKNIFNFIGKSKEELTPEERKSKAILTLSGYAVLFLAIVIMGYFVNRNNFV